MTMVGMYGMGHCIYMVPDGLLLGVLLHPTDSSLHDPWVERESRRSKYPIFKDSP